MFYLELFSKLSQYQVQYLLIGGLAVSLHGIERATMDIDITIAMDTENLSHIVAWAEALKLSPVLPVPLNSLKNINLLKKWHQEKNLIAFSLKTEEIAGVTIDILLFPSVNFNKMQQRATPFKIAQTTLQVACIDDLISLKKTANRAIDVSDIAHLQRLKNNLKNT